MALTTALCTSFKQELLQGLHDFRTTGDSFKLALFDQASGIAGTFGAATTGYPAISGDELAAGGGYTAGGNALTNVNPTTSGTTAFTDFADTQWTSATFVTRGAILYNDTETGDPAVAIFDFGADKSVSAGTFTIQFPTADASNAIIRIA